MRQRSAPTRHYWLAMVATFLLAATLTGAGLPGRVNASPSAAPAAGKIVLKTLSNRADLVSDGSALVEVTLPRGVPASQVRLWIGRSRTKAPQAGDRDVTKAFAVRRDGKLQGLVAKLKLGKNVLSARLPDGRGAWLDITNHPRGGPVFSGPQLQPWKCQAGAVDKQCNQPATFSYLYKSTNPLTNDALQPYDPANPPTDVATTTTDEGVTVPFVVRVEIGYQDRDQYRIAMLWQPGKPWSRWSPQKQWNQKLLVTHGGGCGVSHEAGVAGTAGTEVNLPIPGLRDALGDSVTYALGKGYATMSTALINTVHNCNVVTNAESLMMAKEHLVERYGDVRYTIGTGCSGGSIAQQTIANAYPGLYQGLIVTCSYPDSYSPGIQFADYHLLRKYFESTNRLSDGLFWNPLQWAAVEGHLLPLNAIVADEGLFKSATNPAYPCPGVSDRQRYHPENNPGGTRCSILDAAINVFGPRPREVWTPQEKKAGRGFANVPFDNTGIQYGLEALRSGAITPAQFVDLNTKIGGIDLDQQPTAKRMVADLPALQRMYRSGLLNGANNLSDVAIIDHGGPDPGLAHDARWAWAMRDRLQREQGHFDNHVIWYGAFPIIGDGSYATQALHEMDRWLAAVEADKRGVSLADKVVQDRPGNLHDRCTQVQGVSTQDGLFLPLVDPLVDKLTGGVLDQANTLLNPVLDPLLNLVVDPVSDLVCGLGPVGELVKTDLATPRIVAGDNNYSDNAKCQLKPLRRTDDYGVLGLTDAQWATMKKVFPHGVCDYSKPGVKKTDTVAWLSYQGKDGKAIYGGIPLPPRPRSTPFAGGSLSILADPGSENGAAESGTEGSNVEGEPDEGNQVAPIAHVPAGSDSPADTGGLLPQTGLSAGTLRLLGIALALVLAGSILLRRGRPGWSSSER